jgi:glycosyltransferase involved in cell wall biosynthesis
VRDTCVNGCLENSNRPMADVVMVSSTLAADGGLPVAVANLARAVATTGRQVRVVGPCSGDLFSGFAGPNVATEVMPTTCGLAALVSAVRQMRRTIRDAASAVRRPAMLHIHGIWTPLVVAAGREAIRARLPYVVSPHGMLLEPALRRHWVRKRVAIAMTVRRILEAAKLVHCSSVAEAEAVRRVAPGARTITIPFGVDQPADRPSGSNRRPKVAGYVGRLVQVKNLDTLVRAWAAERPQGWTLRIAGPDGDGSRGMLARLVEELGLPGAVILEDAVPGAEVTGFLSAIAVFIQPSRSENFGIGIAEALAAGTPVITTTGTPWAGITDHTCGWYVEPTEKALRKAIAEAVASTPESLAAMGQRGAEWMAAEYSWPAIAPRYLLELYGFAGAHDSA